MAICAVASFSLAQSVTSANVVGYTAINVPVGFQMIAFNFSAIGGGTNTLGSALSGSISDGDELWVKSGSTWTLYSYSSFDGGWEDIDFNLVNSLLVPNGTAMWYHKISGPGTITFAGEVGVSTSSIHLPVGFTQFGSASPVAFNPNDSTHVTWSGLADGCEIWKKTGGTWTLYSYSAFDGGWEDIDFNLVSTIVDVGQGVWFHNIGAGAVTLSQSNPLQ